MQIWINFAVILWLIDDIYHFHKAGICRRQNVDCQKFMRECHTAMFCKGVYGLKSYRVVLLQETVHSMQFDQQLCSKLQFLNNILATHDHCPNNWIITDIGLSI